MVNFGGVDIFGSPTCMVDFDGAEEYAEVLDSPGG
jgi:hypothetical protein